MIPPFNQDLFQRIYQDLMEIKLEIESTEFVGHEWIDIDQIISNNHQMKEEEKK